MKYLKIAAFAMLFLFGCKKKNDPDQVFYTIVDDNFLLFADTLAYKTGKFILMPGDSAATPGHGNQKINVLIDTVIHDSKLLATSMLPTFRKDNLSAFENLISDTHQSKLPLLDAGRINQTGRYNLVPSGTVEKIDSSYAGQIIISRPYITTDSAIFFITIKAGDKAGITNAYFLSRNNSDWAVLRTFEVERW